MIYLILLPLFIAAILLYFRIAERYSIVDKPNERSSHTIPTIRGGGIIFLLAAIMSFFWNGYNFPFLLGALLISGIISFMDDLRPLPNILKFSAHLASVLLIFKECGILESFAPLYLVGLGFIIIGIINAYNFMDGINGITGLYSLAVVVPLLISETNPQIKSLQLFLVMSLVVFNFFNTRLKARCFAGDVGSITLAILIVFFIIIRIRETGNFCHLGILLIYGIDTIFTLMQRLMNRENIFKSHRKHLYQYLSNERNVSQLLVSSTYALIQLGINFGIVSGFIQITGISIILMVLTIIYWIVKVPFLVSNKYPLKT
ncbi:MAG: UDP-GlcNAc--UDP-phosphate GlcNAc-1-phosphate transferase [Ferruginibacter sp.]